MDFFSVNGTALYYQMYIQFNFQRYIWDATLYLNTNTCKIKTVGLNTKSHNRPLMDYSNVIRSALY